MEKKEQLMWRLLDYLNYFSKKQVLKRLDCGFEYNCPTDIRKRAMEKGFLKVDGSGFEVTETGYNEYERLDEIRKKENIENVKLWVMMGNQLILLVIHLI